MPRCREFDINEALDQALNAFWLKGYASTSLCDLLTAMGLSKSSFYECFGSKRAVLLAALARYSQRELAESRCHFAAARPVPALIADWMNQSLLPNTCRPGERCGCLVLNLAIELAPHDPEIETAVRQHIDALNDCLASVIARGRAEGSLSGKLDPPRAADALLNVLTGTHVLAKGGVERERLQWVIDDHLAKLFANVAVPH
ncbi:TetR/AcrR family transcriptional regulator [Rhodocyclus tenuis]|uniref:TetR/AcrR family transcriptional regulator n=1 Tax=Rhodocyclus gracilis TaxID=2929842 RepID=A0ABX0WJ95_9RHOO|nr:TetR/AcrR family transcriptional regulator [Rhodocyclus gracilis]MRD72933.1 TetR family transcriptional regulator [Rhodocyclus gracilis]NJA88669.1 TetR/AcrR family transcriptional regulator [Rhodocyclus gracilis]